MESLDYYERAFANLRSDKSHSDRPAGTLRRAPHKPLLLLAVLDLYAEGFVHSGFVPISPELGDLFSRYWHTIMPATNRPNLALPFFHLKNDGNFWQLVPTSGNGRVLTLATGPGSMAGLQKLTAGAQLPEALSIYLSNPIDRERLRQVLVVRYFSPEFQVRLLEQAAINREAFDYSQTLLGERMVAEAREAEFYQPAARSQGFRRAIVLAYEYRCATCGIRVTTADGSTAVEAAHIKSWSVSRNDHPTNGLALCKLCHWCFDEGMIGIDQRRTILISRQLESSPNVPAHLSAIQDRPIIGPQRPELAPDFAALRWHQQNVFQAR